MIDNKKVQKALDEVGLTMDGFIVEKYPDAKAANKRVQISRLRNRPADAKGFFNDQKLSIDLASTLNKKANKHYCTSHFLKRNTNISIIGENIKGEIRVRDKAEKFDCNQEYPNHDGIVEVSDYGQKKLKIFAKRTTVTSDDERKECVCKVNNKYYCGILRATSANEYKLLDDNGGVIFDARKVEWASPIKHIICF